MSIREGVVNREMLPTVNEPHRVNRLAVAARHDLSRILCVRVGFEQTLSQVRVHPCIQARTAETFGGCGMSTVDRLVK